MRLLIALGGAAAAAPAMQAACVSPPSNLIGWWAANGSAVDSSAGNHPGTLQGRATYGAGESGLGFALDGNGSYMSAAPSSDWAFGTNAFSIELWANFAASGNRVLVSSDAGGGSNNKWIFWLNNGNLRLHVNNTAGNALDIGTATFNPTLNQWYHLALTRSGSNFTFYVNGAPLETNVAGVTIPDSGSALNIGSAENNYFMAGRLDEVSLYKKALSAAEVLSVFQAGIAGKCGASSAGAGVPYFTDFETGIGSEWGVPALEGGQPSVFTKFTGRLGNSSQSLVLTNLTPGQIYTAGFDLYIIDSWDGGGDQFDVSVDGNSVFHASFSNFGAQSYAGSPDEGQADYGFTQGYPDAIYRNLELSFTASNAVTVLTFTGLNLEALDNESWGLDNVGVRLKSSLPGTVVRTTTLPAANSTNAVALDYFTVSASHPLQTAAASAASSWILKSAGPDGTLGNGDDVAIPVTISIPGTGGRSVAFSISNPPLQPGHYRFQSVNTLVDTNSTAVPVFTRDFTIANPVAGAIEDSDNDSIATST
ncbi:MAG TPA: LamG domain-containing protein, partial [Verrucomicrobiae bacterium]